MSSLSAWEPERWPVALDWQPVLQQFLLSQPGQNLRHFIEQRLDVGAIIYPPQPFLAMELTPLSQVKVVILGQDPYHGPGQAQGLAFSVAMGAKLPPSLRNIYKEIARDPLLHHDGLSPSPNGSLEHWARQGVLLLNTCLTVEDGLPASHARRGWELLTDAIIRRVAAEDRPLVFMLWGAHAQAKQALIPTGTRHLVLSANHPSPLSAMRPPQPFLDCGHFGLANAFLQQHGLAPVAWGAGG
jgi:uracil-DNA glycosylase